VLLLGLILGFAVILSEGLVVHRTAIVPARDQSSSVRRVGEDGRGLAASLSEPQYFLDFDGYYWVSYARQMVSEKEFRVRRTDLDNVPFGRPVHWSSVFAWWLILLGGVQALVSGVPFDSAISGAAYGANPILMGLMLCAAGWSVYRRLGNRASFLLVMLLALQPALLRDFGYGRPDHHGLHLICALGVVLLTVLGGGGWVRRDDDPAGTRSRGNGGTPGIERFTLVYSQARRWFIASGLVGGCGLWIGATQQALIIGCLGLGAFAATIAATREAGPFDGSSSPGEDGSALRWAPELWRLWSRVGALTSFAAYLIEYFPADLGIQLEVNNPLYSLAWLSAGEILYCIGERRLRRTPWTGYPAAKLGLMVGGIGLLPALAYWGPTDWYLIKDPLMLRVHSVIGEFRPLISEIQDPWRLAGELMPALLVILGIGFLRWGREPRLLSTLLAITSVPSLCLLALFLFQARWGGLFVVVSWVVAVPLLLVAGRMGPMSKTRSRVAAVLVLAVMALQLVPNAARAISRADDQAPGTSFLPLADEVLARDIALVLGSSVAPGAPPLTVVTGLGLGSKIHFFGQTRALGSLYWENLDGVRDTVDFFADEGELEALRIARERGADYVVVTADMVSMAAMLKHGDQDLEGIERTLGYRLIRPENGIPAWLRPVRIKGFRWNDRCRVYRVTGLE